MKIKKIDMPKFDYISAKKAGLSDDEIQSFLKEKGINYNLVEAKKAGVEDSDIQSLFNNLPEKKKTNQSQTIH